MAGGRTLTPQEVVERLNRSLEQELSNLKGDLPASPTTTRPCPPACPVPQQTLTLVDATPMRDSVGVGALTPRMRANASLLDKLEASRLRALETLSSVLFGHHDRHDRGGSHPASEAGANPASRGGCVVGCKAKRLRRTAAILVQQERESLLHELHAELDLERKRFEARKPALSEEAYRAARREHASALEKKEHELRMVLARREFKDLKDAARERLSMAHAQEKERILARLRRSLGRGTGHSVSGLREELWEEAHEKRTRALHEGEAAFEHSCRLLRQQSHDRTKAKIEVMAEEAALAEQSALAVLREVETNASADELSRVATALERERREAEAELKQQLNREAARSVSRAVDAGTNRHKQAQQEMTATAAEALRRALELAGEEEVARTKAVLKREARMLDDRRFALISAAEDGLRSCSLRKLAMAGASCPPLSPSRSSSSSSSSSSPPLSPVGRLRPSFLLAPSQPSPILTSERNRNNGGHEAEVVGRPGVSADGRARGSDHDGDVRSPTDNTDRTGRSSSRAYAECAAAAAGAVKAVRHVEGAAAAAEREYARRARDVVRLRAAVALREQRSDKSIFNGADGVAASPAIEHEQGAGEGVGVCRNPAERGVPGMACGVDEGRVGGGDGLVGCGGCAVLFEANERLLDEARARGFINE